MPMVSTVYVCVCIPVHTCACMFARAFLCMPVHVCECVHVCAHANTCARVHMHACVHAHKGVFACAHVWFYSPRTQVNNANIIILHVFSWIEIYDSPNGQHQKQY